MIYTTPAITDAMQLQLDELDALRSALGREVGRASPWLGTLRRLAKAAAAVSSTSIEGFTVPGDEAVAIVSGEQPVGPEDENRMAVASYAPAIEHGGGMSGDPPVEWAKRGVLDFHFDPPGFHPGT